MTILIVDDIALNRKLLRVQLEGDGKTVVEASDGVQGLEVLKETKIDAIISDILMPNMDGYRFCYEVRSNPLFVSIPFVFYTNTFTSPSDETVALELGADRFLKKPAPAREVVATLEQLMALPRSRQAEPRQPKAEIEILKGYSELLIAKLEKKNLELQERTLSLETARSQVYLQAAALESAANSVVITDPGGVIIWTNPAFTQMSGYTPEEAVGNTLRLIKSGQQGIAFYKTLWDTILAGNIWHGDVINRRKNGSTFHCSLTITPVFLRDGVISNFVGIGNDVTEQRRAEGELEAAREKIQHIIDHTPAVLYRLHLRGNDIIPYFVSENITRLLGFQPTEVLSMSWWLQQVHPDDVAAALASRHETIREGTSRSEYRIRHKDGAYRSIEDNCRVIRDASGLPVEFAGVWTDVTDRKRLEDQLRQAQKMEVVGQLAGGVAHDLNNILTVINGYSDMLLHDPETPASSTEMLKQIFLAGERAADLTRHLLAFSRKQVARMQPLDLNATLTDIVKMLKRLIGSDIRLELRQEPGLPTISADPGMIEQVIINLSINARDAMPDAGTLLLSTESVSISKVEAQQMPAGRPGRFVCLSVKDTGTGISSENLAHIFEPFFTTKGEGKGTGLGLSTVHGIIHQHCGWITVETESDHGTTFRVYLPAVETAAQQGSTDVKMKPVGGNETILIVEDEGTVRALAVIVLEKLGYRVLDTADGDEALKIWESQRSCIDLLLTDMVMPGTLTGRKLADKLVAEKPALKVVFSSGYNSETAGQVFDIRKTAPFLQKPYHPHKLAEVIRLTLDTQSKGTAP